MVPLWALHLELLLESWRATQLALQSGEQLFPRHGSGGLKIYYFLIRRIPPWISWPAKRHDHSSG
jgi:hypothetical protein